MIPTDKLRLDNIRDVEEALVVQDAVNVVPAFWVLYSSFLGLLVLGLLFV